MNKSKAFTLAEVLITLTIIGVIAALTIPNLMKNYQNHANYSALKKNYNILQNAYKLVENEYGHFSDWANDGTCAVMFADRIAPYLKIQKICESYTCHRGTLYGLNKGNSNINTYGANATNTKSFVLDDGTVLIFRGSYDANNIFYGFPQSGRLVFIIIDLNGNKGPNTLGRDVFIIGINSATNRGGNKDVLMPAGYFKCSNCDSYFTCKPDGNGISCAYRVLFEDFGIKY